MEAESGSEGWRGNLNGSPGVREARCQATFTLTHRSRSTKRPMQPMGVAFGDTVISASMLRARGPSRSRGLSQSTARCFAVIAEYWR